MPRIEVPFVVEKQLITQSPTVKLVGGGQNYFYATFNICDTWKKVSGIKVVFTRENIVKVVALTKGDNCWECEIPWEVMAEKGVFYVGIFGNDLLLTDTAYVEVSKGCLTEGDEPLEPTPDWFTHVEKELENKVDKVDGKGLSTNDFTDELKDKLENELIPSIVRNVVSCINMFDGEWEEAVLNADGTTKPSNNYLTNTNFAKVIPGKYLVVSITGESDSTKRVLQSIYKYVFYDAQYNLLEYKSSAGTMVLVPEGAKFAKVSPYGGHDRLYSGKVMFELLDSDDTSTISSVYSEYFEEDVVHYGFTTDKMVNAANYTVANGIVDDTEGLQKALDYAVGGELYIPKGTYKVSRTLFIHENTIVRGSGINTIIQLAQKPSLTGVVWRTDYKYPVITTDASVDGASNITIRDITIYGDTTTYNTKSQIGLFIRADDCMVENVHTKNMNYFPETFEERTGANAPAYGIGVMDCKKVNIIGCTCNGNGYEGIGTENCADIIISNCFVGDGNRTGIQVHRNCHNVTIANCTIENKNALKHADITMHGYGEKSITDVKILGCTIKGGGETKGVIEFVAGQEQDVIISSCNIEATTAIIYHESGNATLGHDASIIVKGNILRSADKGLDLYGSYIVCCDNVIDSATNAIKTKSEHEPIVANNLFVNDNTHNKTIAS